MSKRTFQLKALQSQRQARITFWAVLHAFCQRIAKGRLLKRDLITH